jgi:hypothetical protein
MTTLVLFVAVTCGLTAGVLLAVLTEALIEV